MKFYPKHVKASLQNFFGGKEHNSFSVFPKSKEIAWISFVVVVVG